MLPHLVDCVPNNNIREDLLSNVAPAIRIDILSRLPVVSIVRCKCVCKSWRDLIESSDFVTAHLSKSSSAASGVALIRSSTEKPYKICYEVDMDGCSTISNFHFPNDIPWSPLNTIFSSVDGLLLFFHTRNISRNLFICNPVTREYIQLPSPPLGYQPRKATFGFGASKVTGQYKLVMIAEKSLRHTIGEPHDTKCMVYSLPTGSGSGSGLGSWRSIATASYAHDSNGTAPALINGNLHWLAGDYGAPHVDENSQIRISCFDLETEIFTCFSLPPCEHSRGYWILGDCFCYLSALEGRLCLCDNDEDGRVVIWFMNKYGDANSWVKEFSIPSHFEDRLNFGLLSPIKLFRDSGDKLILLGVDNWERLVIYSSGTKSIREYDHLRWNEINRSTRVVNYTPSFLSLRTIGFQNVASLDVTSVRFQSS